MTELFSKKSSEFDALNFDFSEKEKEILELTLNC
jgi:hypothetical protein